MTSNSSLCMKDSCAKLAGHSGNCKPFTSEPLENLPKEILKKIDKTTMTRGAQPYERVPFQNRVRRWNRAVIPLQFHDSKPAEGYENGYVVLVRPEEYFDSSKKQPKKEFPQSVVIGNNAFMYYDNRSSWNNFNPQNYDWRPRKLESDSRRNSTSQDVGEFLARVPATTAEIEVVEGVPQGIRFFEYASRHETWKTTMQLAYLAWKTKNIEEFADGEISDHLKSVLREFNLNDDEKLEKLRVLKNGHACCPLCREIINASELMEKVEQAPGREVVDLTITQVNLFHLKDLKPGEFNHGIYKLGWGHYHCNAVARDNGIENTLQWMESVLINEGRVKKI